MTERSVGWSETLFQKQAKKTNKTKRQNYSVQNYVNTEQINSCNYTLAKKQKHTCPPLVSVSIFSVWLRTHRKHGSNMQPTKCWGKEFRMSHVVEKQRGGLMWVGGIACTVKVTEGGALHHCLSAASSDAGLLWRRLQLCPANTCGFHYRLVVE